MALLTNINGKFSVSDAGAVTFNNAFTFPTADGNANYVLQTNGSGQIGWAANGSVTGSGSATRVAFWSSASAITSDADLYWDNTNKRLGIGVSSPAALLEINGTGDAIRVESTNTGAGGAQIDLLHFTTSPADNDTFALINMGGYYTGTTSVYGTSIKSIWTDVSARNAALTFSTNNAGTLAERMRIDSSGTTMITKTQVTGSFDTTSFLRLHPSSTVNSGGFTNIFFGTSELDNYGISLGGLRTGDIGEPTFIIKTHNNNATGTERMRIDNDGIITVGNRGSDLVYDPTAYQNDLIIERKNNDGSNQLATLRFNVTGYVGQTTGEASIGAVQTSNASSADLVFGTRNNGTRSEKMRIDSSGDVSIKTGYLSLDSKANNSASVADEYRLALGHDASTDASWIQSNGVSGTQRKLLLNPNGGNVGIGTTSPGRKLTVTGDASGDANNLLLVNENDTDGDSASIGFSMLSSNDYVKAGIFFKRTTTQGRGDLIFATNNEANGNNVTSSNARLTIKSSARIEMSADVTMSGSVGIGETTLQRKFNLYDGTDTWTRVQCGASTADWLLGIAGSDHTYKWYNQSSNGGAGMKMTLATSGTLTVSADIVAYGSPSDIRLKENIKPIESALDKVVKLQGVTFDWKEKSITNLKEDIGFIAQDVQKVVPELVRENEDGMLSMRHQGIAPILLEAIKELKAEIEELKLNKCNCNK